MLTVLIFILFLIIILFLIRLLIKFKKYKEKIQDAKDAFKKVHFEKEIDNNVTEVNMAETDASCLLTADCQIKVVDDENNCELISSILKKNGVLSNNYLEMNLHPIEKNEEHFDILIRKSKHHLKNLINNKKSAKIDVENIGSLFLNFNENEKTENTINITNWWDDY